MDKKTLEYMAGKVERGKEIQGKLNAAREFSDLIQEAAHIEISAQANGSIPKISASKMGIPQCEMADMARDALLGVLDDYIDRLMSEFAEL